MNIPAFPIFVTTHGMNGSRAMQASTSLTRANHDAIPLTGALDVSLAPIGRGSEGINHKVSADALRGALAPLLGAPDEAAGHLLLGTTVSIGYSDGRIAHLSAEHGPVASAARAVSDLLLTPTEVAPATARNAGPPY